MLRSLLISIALLATACSDENQASPGLDEPFPLGLGEQRSVDRGTLRLTFVAVSEDSRCPNGVQCVQAGQATVILRAEQDAADAQELELTIPEPDSADYTGYRIQLLALAPYPEADSPTPTSDYEATLLVRTLTP